MRPTTSLAMLLFSLMAVIPARTQTKDASDIEAVKQVEQTMGSALIAGDIDKLSHIYADNYATVGSDGKLITKETLLSDFASFHDKLEWFENGPMDIQIFGDIALAQGSVKEKRSENGKDTSGQFLWQDVLQRSAGKWVVWRSAAARVVLADAPAQPHDRAIVAAIEKFESDLGDAMVAKDIEKINHAYADDWVSITSSGEKFTKEGLLEDFKSGKHELMSFENGPINVQVFGDVAVVQAGVKEKRVQEGRSISGQFVFMDLLKRRAGKWVIVRSLAAGPGMIG